MCQVSTTTPRQTDTVTGIKTPLALVLVHRILLLWAKARVCLDSLCEQAVVGRDSARSGLLGTFEANSRKHGPQCSTMCAAVLLVLLCLPQPLPQWYKREPGCARQPGPDCMDKAAVQRLVTKWKATHLHEPHYRELCTSPVKPCMLPRTQLCA